MGSRAGSPAGSPERRPSEAEFRCGGISVWRNSDVESDMAESWIAGFRHGGVPGSSGHGEGAHGRMDVLQQYRDRVVGLFDEIMRVNQEALIGRPAS